MDEPSSPGANIASIPGAVSFRSPSPSRLLGGSLRSSPVGGRPGSPVATRASRVRNLSLSFAGGNQDDDDGGDELLTGANSMREYKRGIDLSSRLPDPGLECWNISSSRGSEALGMRESDYYTMYGGTSLTRARESFESPERRMRALEESISSHQKRGWGLVGRPKSSEDAGVSRYWEGRKVEAKRREKRAIKQKAKRETSKGKENNPRGGFFGLGGGAKPVPPSPSKSPVKKKTRALPPAVACISMGGVCVLPARDSDPEPEPPRAARREVEELPPRPAKPPAALHKAPSLPIPQMSVSETVADC
mmetsp:Transcript_28189/g.89788  ORF Transcript_28189/g.89788 Transcript_28189/m.89788 type:complete len:306 (+) Transcript_28189:144-1061(+)